MNSASRYVRLPTLCLVIALATACSDEPKEAPATAPVADAPVTEQPVVPVAEPEVYREVMLADSNVVHVVVEEAFVTGESPGAAVDSTAVWQAADGSTWLYATAKDSDQLLIFDGESGMQKGFAGGPGDGPNQFDQPNGLYVINNLLLVVERGNHRVQVLSLPALQHIGSFGEDLLKHPYGVWARSVEGGVEAIISDSYMTGSEGNLIPPLADLGQRYRRFELRVDEGTLSVTGGDAFGATDAAGAIKMAESVFGDVVQNRLLLAEEHQGSGTRIKVYSIDGEYSGQDIGAGLFKAQVEGMALFDCADGSGYWLATDQFKDRSLFHLFDRQSLAHVGSFAGNVTANTDGVWLQQAPSAAFPNGAFYAVHADRAVAAFDWRSIAKATGVRASCGE